MAETSPQAHPVDSGQTAVQKVKEDPVASPSNNDTATGEITSTEPKADTNGGTNASLVGAKEGDLERKDIANDDVTNAEDVGVKTNDIVKGDITDAKDQGAEDKAASSGDTSSKDVDVEEKSLTNPPKPATTSRDAQRPKKNNRKSDLESQKESSDPFEIRKQVEFYFSDSNLASDRFLFEKTGGHLNKPVKIDTLCNFKRMRRFRDRKAIVDALKESSVLVVVDDDTAVRRKSPLVEAATVEEATKALEDKVTARSVYVKGFGEEKPSTQFDIEAFFAVHGTTNQVRLRRHSDKTFKGSVTVEFENDETAKAFLSLEPKPTYNGNSLITMSKQAHHEEKLKEMELGMKKVDPFSKRAKRDYNAQNWNERRKQERALGSLETTSWRGRDGKGRSRRGDNYQRKKRPRDNDDEDEEDTREAKKVETGEDKEEDITEPVEET